MLNECNWFLPTSLSIYWQYQTKICNQVHPVQPQSEQVVEQLLFPLLTQNHLCFQTRLDSPLVCEYEYNVHIQFENQPDNVCCNKLHDFYCEVPPQEEKTCSHWSLFESLWHFEADIKLEIHFNAENENALDGFVQNKLKSCMQYVYIKDSLCVAVIFKHNHSKCGGRNSFENKLVIIILSMSIKTQRECS